MSRHISEQYDLELGAIRERLMEMATLVEQQVNNAGTAYINHDLPLAMLVRETEARLNHMEVEIDDQCIGIIARRQPAASDLREVIAMMKMVTDFERIGDEANRIANLAYELADQEVPQDQYSDIREIHTTVEQQLHAALDAFARKDIGQAEAVIAGDRALDQMYRQLVDDTTVAMQSERENIDHLMSKIWTARAYERIGDHAKNVCEYVIFQSRGYDVRHGNTSADQL